MVGRTDIVHATGTVGSVSALPNAAQWGSDELASGRSERTFIEGSVKFFENSMGRLLPQILVLRRLVSN